METIYIFILGCAIGNAVITRKFQLERSRYFSAARKIHFDRATPPQDIALGKKIQRKRGTRDIFFPSAKPRVFRYEEKKKKKKIAAHNI